ncbi:MAG: 3,4-dihydroxy-2-butanone-4-phosphate synthase [Myxococcota bacterium]
MEFEVMAPDPERRVQTAIDAIRAGKMVILVDDEDRENEGDLTMAASMVTPEAINFMAKWGRGLICLTLTEDRVAELQLPMMATNNRSPFATAFTVSIEAREGVSTGISAADRAHTIQVAIDAKKGAGDLISPGHVFPLRARDGGVLVRTGQTEGSVDLARLAGLPPAGVICEIMNDDGTMARLSDLERFAAEHKLHIVTVADVVRWRLRNERLVRRVLETPMPTEEFGELKATFYQDTSGGMHLALSVGDLAGGPVLARVQSSTGPVDVFRALTSDSSDQLRSAVSRIAEEGRGVLLYLHIDGGPSPEAYLARLKEHLVPGAGSQGEGDKLRGLGTGAQILLDLGVKELRLLTNNPRKIVGLEGFGLRVVERIPLHAEPRPDRSAFLESRRQQLGHLLER